MPVCFSAAPTGIHNDATKRLIERTPAALDEACHIPDVRIFLREYPLKNAGWLLIPPLVVERPDGDTTLGGITVHGFVTGEREITAAANEVPIHARSERFLQPPTSC